MDDGIKSCKDKKVYDGEKKEWRKEESCTTGTKSSGFFDDNFNQATKFVKDDELFNLDPASPLKTIGPDKTEIGAHGGQFGNSWTIGKDKEDTKKPTGTASTTPKATASSAAKPTATATKDCTGKSEYDIDCNAKIDIKDFSEIIKKYKTKDMSVDFNKDKTVNISDISLFIAEYRKANGYK